MVVIVFRSRVREGAEEMLNETGARMYALATTMPGYVSYKDFRADDGEQVAIVQFQTQADSERWRDHPEHRAVQEQARRFFSEYSVQVCELVRQSRFPTK